MATLQSSTPFTIQAAEAYEEQVDLIILPQAPGTESMRELHYPDDLFPPIIYPGLPDRWENFDTIPLTNPPLTKAEMTLGGNKYSRYKGYKGDRPVREIWRGDDNNSLVPLDFFRSLIEYFFNQPDPPDYITWWPKDRSASGFKVLIEDLSIGGASVLTFDYVALFNSVMTGEMILTMRIIEEVT
jgi:hypothetical protein